MISSRRQKKKCVISCLIILILLVTAFFSIKSYLFPSFSGGFSKIQRIEAQYNGDFRNEKINVTSIKREDFGRFIEYLEEFNDALLKKRNTTDIQALNKFAQIRMSMLKSEKFFRLGDDIGNVGKVKDIDGFRCSEMNYILNAAYYFNRSWTYGVDTQLELDDLLVQYKKVPKLHELVGIDDTKTKFYKSDLRAVKHFALTNVYSLEYYCGYTGGAPKTLKPFELVSSPEGNKRVVPVENAI